LTTSVFVEKNTKKNEKPKNLTNLFKQVFPALLSMPGKSKWYSENFWAKAMRPIGTAYITSYICCAIGGGLHSAGEV